jgi:hypothetical protein
MTKLQTFVRSLEKKADKLEIYSLIHITYSRLKRTQLSLYAIFNYQSMYRPQYSQDIKRSLKNRKMLPAQKVIKRSLLKSMFHGRVTYFHNSGLLSDTSQNRFECFSMTKTGRFPSTISRYSLQSSLDDS